MNSSSNSSETLSTPSPIDKTPRYDLSTLPAPIVPSTIDGETGAAKNPTDAYVWSGSFPLPGIGAPVTVRINGLGTGIVRAYFVEHGWIGVHVTLDTPPDWHVKQNAGRKYPGQALVFGIEIKP